MIWIPVDYHEETAPSPAMVADWLAQVPAEVGVGRGGEGVFLADWRKGKPETLDLDLVRPFAPKEMARAKITGADQNALLLNLSRFWRAARERMDAKPPTAFLLWNCGNGDQNVWLELARLREIPVMHAEHGWLPETLIFDPRGGYVQGRSGWDDCQAMPADGGVGADLIRRWRAARKSKHAQGDAPLDLVRTFCERGPALLVAGQLETDGAMVYHETEFASQRELVRKCLTWPGPVVVKEHPAAGCIEWEPEFYALRRYCRMETEVKGGLWLDGNESLHDLLPLFSAVAAINSNVLFEAAMSGKPAYAFGKGPHSGQGFTVDMAAGDEWQEERPQSHDEWRAVCEHVARMRRYLTPVGAWACHWQPDSFWGGSPWADARSRLVANWQMILGEGGA